MQTTKRPPSPFIKLAIEAGPLLVFFLLNARKDIYWATGGFMIAIVLSLIASWRMEGKLPSMPLFTAFFVLVFGGLTIYLQNDTFIKVKPTIVNSLFAVILFASLARPRTALEVAFGTTLPLNAEGWRALTFRWGIFCVVLAVLNEIVWRSFSTDTWVAFKTFGILPLTVVFMLSQARLLQRHQTEVAPGEGHGGSN